mmetsp:Transcript_14846/g.46707  ORF Transcript_14846/g.46707 Transcript_14846/m.46707 type:complete len:217 (+) Transcript_14846:41-691(+)
MARGIVLALALFFVEAVSGFVAPVSQSSASSLKAAPLDEMAGVSTELGLDGKVFDPLGLAQINPLIKDSEHYGVFPSVQWLRESELKHGRMAMLAFTGACVQSAGITFPGELLGYYYEKNVNWADGFSSAVKTNPLGMFQIFLFIHVVETKFWPNGAWLGSMERAPGDLGLNIGGKKDDPRAQLKELKNGRAAMIGMMALSAAHFIPGSVPFYSVV